MEQPNENKQPIAIGAVVEALDGFVGVVAAFVMDPQTQQPTDIVVENEDKTEQFTLPMDLVSGQVGTRVVRLKINRSEVIKQATNVQVDTQTANFGHPNIPHDTSSVNPPPRLG
ncbi:MAG TPA: hypothetical protein VH186_13965 [Chloroflexia bacterium]|nr:hypothetical protein [Chloroflexia bacterium]